MNIICQLVILFFIFSVAGWCMEVVLKYIQYHRFINRGFLVGPYCPIYGWGVVAVTVLVGGLFSREGTVSEIFWAGYAFCGILEYFTSWYMEKRFHARWWDYSNKPMNLHGRIWVGNLLLFGLGSVIIVLIIDPVFFRWADRLDPFWLHTSAIVILVLLLSDHAVTAFLMNVVRKEIDAQEGDNTEEITEQVRLLLRDRHLLIRRIEQAYPDLRTKPEWLTVQVKEAHKDYKEAGRKVAELMKKSKRQKMLLHDIDWHAQLEKALEREKHALNKLQELERKLWYHSDDR